jgi:hypothetical protein
LQLPLSSVRRSTVMRNIKPTDQMTGRAQHHVRCRAHHQHVQHLNRAQYRAHHHHVHHAQHLNRAQRLDHAHLNRAQHHVLHHAQRQNVIHVRNHVAQNHAQSHAHVFHVTI